MDRLFTGRTALILLQFVCSATSWVKCTLKMTDSFRNAWEGSRWADRLLARLASDAFVTSVLSGSCHRAVVNGLAHSPPREGPGLPRLHACFPFEFFLPLSFLKAHVDTLMMGPGSESLADSTWSPWPADDGATLQVSPTPYLWPDLRAVRTNTK